MNKIKLNDLRALIERALELPAGHLPDDATPQRVAQWDSLGHLNIVAALDEYLEGRVMLIPEIGSATSLTEVIQALNNNDLLE